MSRSLRVLLVFAVLYLGLVFAEDPAGSGENDDDALLSLEGRSLDPSVHLVNVFPAALSKGAIGHTTGDMLLMKDFAVPESHEKRCRWLGTAPLCDGECPRDYEEIRKHDGRCFYVYDKFFKDSCIPDPSFGARCHFKSYKALCCRKKTDDCSWAGYWVSTKEDEGRTLIHNCAFVPGKVFNSNMDWTSCGNLKCSGDGMDKMAIFGDDCNRLEWEGLEGRVSCGLVTWHNTTTGEITHKWYKN